MSASTPSMFSQAAAEMAARLGLKLGRPNLEEFGATLLKLATENPQIVAVTSDSRGSGKLVNFGSALPAQLVELGIAEQNLVGVAAGLSSVSKIVFAVSPACFLTARALEQIKNDVAYSNNPVKLIGISAGVSYGRSDRPIIRCTIWPPCGPSTTSTSSFRRIISKPVKRSKSPPPIRARCISASARRRSTI